MSIKLRVAARRSLLCCAAVVVVAALMAAPAAARTLAQARAICPDGSVCLFEHHNYDGKYVSFRYGISDFRAFGFSDLASSYVNDGTSHFCVYEHVNYAWTNPLGRRIMVYPWGYDPSLHDYPYFADIASSGSKADWAAIRWGC